MDSMVLTISELLRLTLRLEVGASASTTTASNDNTL